MRASALAIALLGCESKRPEALVADASLPPPPPKALADAASSSSTAEARAPVRFPPAKAGDEILVPAGKLWLGSKTGSAHRDPRREADRVAVEMGAFHIDALPYPNDPAQSPRHSVTRAEAASLCKQTGKRLCTELEWERACKGDVEAEYPVASHLDPSQCAANPAACASPAGVFALGMLGREWTSSEAKGADWDVLRTAVTRGAGKESALALHRCAARDAATPESKSSSLLFRCCRGELTSETYPVQPEYPAFREQTLTQDALRQALAELTSLKGASAFRPWTSKQAVQALTEAGRSVNSLAPWQAARAPLLWSPMRGEELMVVSGDTPEGALIVAYYPDVDGRAELAGSYLTRGEHTPILVAYKADVPNELLFSTCWGCGGEGGAIQLDDAARVRFVPR